MAQQVVNIEWLLTCSPGRGAHVKAWNRLSWECVWQVRGVSASAVLALSPPQRSKVNVGR